jgi:hypothetical protein
LVQGEFSLRKGESPGRETLPVKGEGVESPEDAGDLIAVIGVRSPLAG